MAEIEELMLRAEQGDPEAQYDLGVRYVWGWDVKKDLDEAHRWFRYAEDQGYTFESLISDYSDDKI